MRKYTALKTPRAKRPLDARALRRYTRIVTKTPSKPKTPSVALALTLTKTEVQEAIATMYGLACEGKLDTEIMEEMGLDAPTYSALKAAMFDAKADEIRGRPTEHVYVQYTIDQAQNIKDLTTMLEAFKTTKQFNAMVGAVRARAEIYNKLIEMGQSFGLIRKEPDKKEIIAGMFIADMTNRQLKTAITGELTDLNVLMRRYGDRTILDMKAGSLHRGPRLPPPPKTAGSEDDPLTAARKAIRVDKEKTRNKTKSKSKSKKHGKKRVKIS